MPFEPNTTVPTHGFDTDFTLFDNASAEDILLFLTQTITNESNGVASDVLKESGQQSAIHPSPIEQDFACFEDLNALAYPSPSPALEPFFEPPASSKPLFRSSQFIYPTPEESPLSYYDPTSPFLDGTPLFGDVPQFDNTEFGELALFGPLESFETSVAMAEIQAPTEAPTTAADTAATGQAVAETPTASAQSTSKTRPDLAALLSNLVQPVFPDKETLQGLSASRSKIRRRPSKLYPCPIADCTKAFTRKFNLQTHLRTHDPERARPFVCPQCNKDFLRLHDLERHEVVHSKAKAHGCPDPDCGKRFTRADALRRHLSTSKCVVPDDYE